MNSFQGIDHKKDRIYIHFDVTTICNYSCTYCCNRAEYTDWQKAGSFDTIMSTFDDIEKLKNENNLPIFLMFTGGEPTMTIRYFQIVERAISLLTHDDDRLVLESNGSRKLEFFAKYPLVNNKVFHMFSVHPEHETYDSMVEYIQKLKLIQSKGYRVKVNLMLNHSEQYWDFIDYAYDLLVENGIEVHPHYIYHKKEFNQIKYSKKFWKRFERFKDAKHEYEIEIDGIIKTYSDNEVFQNKLNHFKGMTCYHNNLCIDLRGNYSNQCFKISQMNDVIDLMKGKPCPYDSCNCDGLLKIRKEI